MRERLLKTKERLDQISPSFCPAKWLQLTLHLSNGHNHSCHHPNTHLAPLEKVESFPMALHNTDFKKQVRKQMLEGEFPSECQYCWNIENNSTGANDHFFSDRIIKAQDDWCAPRVDEVAALIYDADVAPSYLEVSFSSFCNLRCIYCYPHISSSLLWEYQRFGNYRSLETLEQLTEQGKIVSKDVSKRYLEAFWKWYPQIVSKLRVLRLTGGEPLLHQSTYRLLEDLAQNPRTDLQLSINSNFAIPHKTFLRFLDFSKKLVDSQALQSYHVYVSVDSFKAQAEYIRFGLDYSQLIDNIRNYLQEVKAPVVLMVTYNLLSMPGFSLFLEDVVRLKELALQLGQGASITLDIAMLQYPHFLNCRLADSSMLKMAEQSLQVMKRYSLFSTYEIHKFERLIDYLQNDSFGPELLRVHRADFANFIDEYDGRKGTSFSKVFPEMVAFMKNCRGEDA